MIEPLTYGSVCSGIEAATVAWHTLGFRPVFFAEIEPFCCELLKHHYPEVPNYGDFTRIETAPASDILVGGTPCQDFSVAGLRAGLDGERGKLTIEFLKLVERLRTRWVVWENVPGVLSMDEGRVFGFILGRLAELGYGFAYRVLDAQHFGVPQRRRRVFVVGYLGDWRPAAAVLFERDCLSGNPAPRRPAREEVAGSLGGGSGERGWCPDTDRMTFVARAVKAGEQGHRHDPSTDNYIPETAWALQERDHKGPDSDTKDGHLIVTPILEAGARTGRVGHEDVDGLGVGEDGDPMFTLQSGKQHAIAFSAYDAGQGATDDLSPTLRVNGDTSSGQMAVAVRTAQTSANGHGIADEVAHTLDSAQQAVAFKPSHYTRDKDAGPSDVVSPLTADADKGDQDSVVLTFTERTRVDGRNLETQEDIAYALKNPGSGGRTQSRQLMAGSAVRRLTPRECDRLQGFPDDYTRVKYRGKVAADGPRYRALGNSMAVPVMAWIGRRIRMVEDILNAPEGQQHAGEGHASPEPARAGEPE